MHLIVELPEIQKLIKQIEILKKEIAELKTIVKPEKMWYTLKEACALKGINQKTTQNKHYLQPNKGIPDGTIGGRKCWKSETVMKWVLMTDEDIEI